MEVVMRVALLIACFLVAMSTAQGQGIVRVDPYEQIQGRRLAPVPAMAAGEMELPAAAIAAIRTRTDLLLARADSRLTPLGPRLPAELRDAVDDLRRVRDRAAVLRGRGQHMGALREATRIYLTAEFLG